MKLKSLAPLLACVAATLCAMVASAQPPPTERPLDALPAYADPDAYTLYAAYLQQRVQGQHLRLVEARTLPPSSCVQPRGPVGQEVTARIEEAIAHGRAANTQPQRLTDAFPPTVSVRVLTPDEAKAFLWAPRPDGTDRRPLAITQFSAVGFSNDRTVAVLRAAFRTGPGGGSVASHVYVRDGAGWRELPGQRHCTIIF